MAIRIIAVPGNPDAVGYVGVPAGGLAKLKGPYGSRGEWGGLPVLTYAGRQPLVDGVPVDAKGMKDELAEAIEFAGQRVFGQDWIGHVSTVSGLAHRSVQRDRIAEHGLPAPVLQLLARACAHHMPRTLGFAMLSIAYSWREATEGDDPAETAGRMSTSARDELGHHLKGVVDVALDQVDDIRASIFAFRSSTRS
ncbi:hypothetical protein HCU64_00080 [Methylobacterium sp. C25]|uniref:hypothetical protein n=1 Tax=Methylobacterium sp. C25 TaxID=2721622 RepID=UPI001F39882B|nr:hypothetical protein [Methylobacterium sp. C25]MCE4222136.1 hypothetical protein [Methylobacterium sp. C25]